MSPSSPSLAELAATVLREVAQSNSTAAAEAVKYVRNAGGAPARPQSYLIGLQPSCSAAAASVSTLRPLLSRLNITVDWGFDVAGVRGLKVKFTGPSLPLELLSKVPCVAYIEDDAGISLASSSSSQGAGSQNACLQSAAMQSKQSLWGLDAMDGSYDGTYQFDYLGEGANVYVVDSGINSDHPEFEDRAKNVWTANSIQSQAQEDCTGHGTHVAGIIAGKTVGVAKKAKVHGLRIIDCGKTGSVSDAVEALSWLSNNMRLPAIVNLSLGSTETLRGNTLPSAISALVRRGAAVVIAAGNSAKDVCDTSGPSMTTIANTFVVGALDRPSATNVAQGEYSPRMASFSNRGSCIKYWAPGVDVWSASNVTSDVSSSANAFEQRQGTSQAAPFVAGVLALHLGVNPSLTPAQLQAKLEGEAKALPSVSAQALHIMAPRVATLGSTASSQAASLTFPLAQCSMSSTGVLAALSSALGTSRATTIAAASAAGAAVLLAVAFFVIRRARARARRQQNENGIVVDGAGVMWNKNDPHRKREGHDRTGLSHV